MFNIYFFVNYKASSVPVNTFSTIKIMCFLKLINVFFGPDKVALVLILINLEVVRDI